MRPRRTRPLAAAVVMLPPESKKSETICRATFQHLWRLSYIFFRISP
jgi:hypothetical protein